MKLSRSALAGILVVFVGLITVNVYLFFPPRTITYSKMKINVDKLRLLKPNFKTLSFQSVVDYQTVRPKTILYPDITVNTGDPTNYVNIIAKESSETVLRYTPTREYYKYEVSLVQIDSLLAIPGVAYFIAVAYVYPPKLDRVAYSILPYNVRGELIGLNKAFLQLNPCPPALAYQAPTPN